VNQLIDTGTQLYPAERLAQMSDATLESVLRFAQVDAANAWVIYEGMTRNATAATAQRTVDDITAELRRRAVCFWTSSNLAFL